MNRILVIRGGAIGDFVLTLPAIKLLRDRFPEAQIEILGYPHITALAHRRFYADAIRSIEQGSLAKFFLKDSALPEELIGYFGDFDLIISYLFDPDGVFETNLKRCGIQKFIAGPSKLSSLEHGALQLIRPLAQLGLQSEDRAARIYLTNADRDFARDFLGTNSSPTIFHPGSGSETKNWPIENWKALGDHFLSRGRDLLIVSGEAEEDRVRFLESTWEGKSARFAQHLNLSTLAGLFENATFIGHDSGISHIAAAVEARCFLLFGPTDPAVWAPANRDVTVIRAPGQDLRLLTLDRVIETIEVAAGRRSSGSGVEP